MTDPENSGKDDEFHDALSTQNDSNVEDIISKHDALSLEDNDLENSDDNALSEEKNPHLRNFPKHLSDDVRDDYIDEEYLKEQQEGLSDEEKETNKKLADEMKQEGNELFKKEEYLEAVTKYTTALKTCPLEYTSERSVLYSNRAAAKIKVDSKNSAINDCSMALQLNPQYLRAALRRAKLYECTEKYDEALEDFKLVAELDKGNKEAMDALHRLPPIIQERNEKIKEELFGKLKQIGNTILRPFGLSTNNFVMDQDPATGSYSFSFKNT